MEISTPGFLTNELPLTGYKDTSARLAVIRARSPLLVCEGPTLAKLGGSAGGGSVTYQLIAGGAYDQPPFSGAIAEYPWWQPLFNASSQELQMYNVLTLAKCINLNCLRSMSSEQLQSVHNQSYNTGYEQHGYGFGDFYYGPVVDGRFVIELPDQAFKAGRFYDVGLIVDHDGYEGVLFGNTSLTSQIAETTDAELLFPEAGPSFYSRLYQLYPAANFNSTFYQRQTWFGDFAIDCKCAPLHADARSDILYGELSGRQQLE
jgi:carboxylesterase type B